jgi:hypothetical protein
VEPSATKKYWCAQDEADFAKAYFERTQAQGGLAAFGEFARLQLLAQRHYYGALPYGFIGDMPSSAMPTRAGDQGENVEVRVNWLRAHANAKHQIIVAPKLAWGATPTNTDSKSLADASRAGSILEYLWKSGPFERMAISAVLGAIISGEEFLFTPWDPRAGAARRLDESTGLVEYDGDVVCRSIPSWDVLRLPTAKSFEESPWLAVRMRANRYDLIAQYPMEEEAILAAPASANFGVGSAGISLTSVSDPDIVTCHYFFHKKTAALPAGLQAVMVNADCVLEFAGLEPCYEHLPIHRFPAGDLKGTPYGYTSFWEGMGIQDLATDLQGSLATNIMTFAKQMISAESDQDLPVSQLGNGPVVVYRPKGSQPPVPLNLMAPSPESFQHLERYKGDQRMVLGLNDMAMGEPPQGPPNAQAWALLATANITNNSGEQRGYIDGVRSVGRSLLAIYKAKLSAPRKAAIVGKQGASVPQQEQYDAQTFAGIDDVTIEIDNPLMQTAAGRLPIAQMFIESGFVQVPEQLEQVVTTGKLKPITQVLENELIQIEWENEQMLQGICPPVLVTDAHQMHYREHKGVTFIPEGRANPAVIKAYSDHQQQHAQFELTTDPRLLAMSGQAAPAQPPPGAAPPSPPGKQVAPTLAPPGVAAQGEAASVKLPTSPVNPATGSPATPPGGLA